MSRLMFSRSADLNADSSRRSQRGSDPRLIRVVDQRGDPRCGGFSLIEALVALGIFSILAATVLTLALGAFSADLRGEHATRAEALAQEGLEAARSIGRANFSELQTGPHGLSRAGGSWALSGVAETVGSYTRTIAIGAVYRDNGGQGIEVPAGSVGAVVDPLSRRVTSTASWLSVTGATARVNLVTLLTNWSGTALRWLHDTISDFTAGQRSSTQLTATGNGEVRLASLGDWTNPRTLLSLDVAGSEDATACAVDAVNQVLYVTTNQRDDGQTEFFAYDLANVSGGAGSLPLLGSTEIGHGLNAVAVHAGHAYLATNQDAEELSVVRLSDFLRRATWDTPLSGADARDVFATGTVAYLVTKNSGTLPEFFAINIADPGAIPASPLGTAEIGADVNAVAVSADGTHAFLATGDNAGELTVVRLADYAVVRRVDLAGSDDATDVAVAGTTVYVVRDKSSAAAEFVALDAANPASMSAAPLGSTELGKDATGVAILGHQAFVAVKGGSAGLMAIDLNTFNLQGSFDAPGGADTGSVCASGAHAYVVSKANSNEVVVVQGASGGSDYAANGAFTSAQFDSGSARTVWTSLGWTSSGTGTIQLRLRTADTAAHLATARWAGPDGASATAYATPGQSITLDPGATGSRWIQFRAYLTTSDQSATPVLEDVSLYYSP